MKEEGFFSMLNYVSISRLPAGNAGPHTSPVHSRIKSCPRDQDGFCIGCFIYRGENVGAVDKQMIRLQDTEVSLFFLVGSGGRTLLVDNWPVVVMSLPGL